MTFCMSKRYTGRRGGSGSGWRSYVTPLPMDWPNHSSTGNFSHQPDYPTQNSHSTSLSHTKLWLDLSYASSPTNCTELLKLFAFLCWLKYGLSIFQVSLLQPSTMDGRLNPGPSSPDRRMCTVQFPHEGSPVSVDLNPVGRSRDTLEGLDGLPHSPFVVSQTTPSLRPSAPTFTYGGFVFGVCTSYVTEKLWHRFSYLSVASALRVSKKSGTLGTFRETFRLRVYWTSRLTYGWLVYRDPCPSYKDLWPPKNNENHLHCSFLIRSSTLLYLVTSIFRRVCTFQFPS